MLRHVAPILVALLVALAVPATAQRLDVQNLRPGPSQVNDAIGVRTARILNAGQWELGLVAHYADNLLVVRDPDTNEAVSAIVSDQLVTHVLAAVGVGDHFEFGVDLPIILRQTGDEIIGIDGADGTQGGAGVGALRLAPTVNFFDRGRTRGRGAALSLSADLLLPTGREDDWQGEPTRVHPALHFDYQFGGGTRLSLSGGYLVRGATQVSNLQGEDLFTYGAAVLVPVDARDLVHLIVELDGGLTTRGDARGGNEERPLEGRAGVRLISTGGAAVTVGGGLGLLDGAGVPDWRVLLGLAYSRPDDPDRDGDGYANGVDGCPDDPEDFDTFRDDDGCSDPDNDGDGIRDVRDACPLQPEDADGFEDADGCPDLDNDQDGVPDGADACPNEPEDADRFQDADGCPDPDNDGDGVLDVDDSCPNEPEDFDGFEDADGCPDPDNDRDGRPDTNDACPNEPEDFDGFEDADGCPEDGEGLVRRTCDAIEIRERVHFDTDSDVIQARSFPLLDQVATLLHDAPGIRRVRVEGHTDNRGDDDYNLDLSDRRAAAVLRYLTERGVRAERIESAGFGEAFPIADNGTVDGRAENRRVEFRIVDQDTPCDTPAPN